jgi:hypothetical protein
VGDDASQNANGGFAHAAVGVHGEGVDQGPAGDLGPQIQGVGGRGRPVVEALGRDAPDGGIDAPQVAGNRARPSSTPGSSGLRSPKVGGKGSEAGHS